MKKYTVLCAGICVALALTGCKSSESAYRQAYNKAMAAEQQQAQTTPEQQPVVQEQTVTVPTVETKPADQTTVMDNGDNETVRQEAVTVVSGAGLKNFSVVVGSFSLKANAEGLQQTLKSAGYDAQIAKNNDRNMYRVIATTFADKAAAVTSKNQLRAKYADAWLLFAK
jgi:cell division septation protein DedD